MTPEVPEYFKLWPILHEFYDKNPLKQSWKTLSSVPYHFTVLIIAIFRITPIISLNDKEHIVMQNIIKCSLLFPYLPLFWLR